MRSTLRSLVVCAAATMAACVGEVSQLPLELGEARLALGAVPPGLQCLIVTAAAPGKTMQFPFAAPLGATTNMQGIPVGEVVFSATAQDTPCNQSPATAPWVSDRVTVTVRPGLTSEVELVLHQSTGGVQGEVSFQPSIEQLAASDYATFALMADHTVWAWGRNFTGTLGDGTTQNRLTPTKIDALSNVVTISGGSQHACAVKNDGSVWCWGYNNFGQLGDGTTTTRLSPVRVTLPAPGTATQLATGYGHTCALLSNGALSCWGDNSNFQLAQSTVANNQLTPLPGILDTNGQGFLSVAGSGGNTCALTKTGRAMCNRISGQIREFVASGGGGALVEIALAHTTKYGVRADGQLVSWTAQGNPTVSPGLTDVVQIEGPTSDRRGCAVQADGAVYCWSPSLAGVLGNGTTDGSTTPVRVLYLTTAVQVVVGDTHSCALTDTSSVYCWGANNDEGQLGTGDGVNYYAPERVTF